MVSSTFDRILVPLDGSPFSEQVLTAVTSLSQSTGSSIVLVQVVPSGGSIRRRVAHPFRRSDAGETAQLEETSGYLSALAEEIRSKGTDVTIDVAHGPPAEEIVAMATRHRASLIAMCTHGRTGIRRLALGSVAEQVLRRSAMPLFLYRPTDDGMQRSISWSKVVVPLDGSPLSELALQQASEVATAAGLSVELVHVLSDTSQRPPSGDSDDDEASDRRSMETYLQDQADALSQQGIQASYRIIDGDPKVQMADAATGGPDVLMVMSTHGRTGLGRMRHGSVAEEVVRRSSSPVLLVRGRPSTIGAGRYRLLRLLGEGNRKEVYLSYDTQDDREVAVTLVKSQVLSPQEVDRIKAGATSVTAVGDQVAAPLYLDVGEEQGYVYMISAALERIEERIFNRNFVLVSVGTLMAAVGLSVFHPTVPLHVESIGGTATDVSRVVGIIGLGQLLARPLVGWLVDGKGRRNIALLGMALIAAASLVLAWAPSIPMLMLGRFLIGVGFAMAYTAIVTMVGEIVPPDRRGESQAAFGMFPQLGLGLGPVIGIWLMFGSFAPGSQAAASQVQGGSFTVAALAAAGIAGASVLAFLLVEDPYRAPGLRRRPRLSDSIIPEAAVATVVNFSVWMTRAATFTIFPVYAIQQGLDNPGLFLLVVALGAFPARQIIGKASDRHGFPVVFLPGLGLVAASILLIPMTHSALGLLVLGGVLGLGLGAVVPSLTAYAASSVSNEKRGAAINTFTLGGDLAMSVGALALGFFAARTGTTSAFMVAGLSPVMAIMFFGAVKVMKRASLQAEGEPAER